VNGTTQEEVYRQAIANNINTINLFRQATGTAASYWTGRMYYITYKESGSNVFNLIPAKRDSDGAIGMYDTVSGQFFTNAGTGEFIGGQPVFN
ncbi:MAG: hypothetical protein IKL95_03785, partial [Alphaproteobacteria bacterium]|nr:hypothetical protein [Alphaproteobacteria bacterium]